LPGNSGGKSIESGSTSSNQAKEAITVPSKKIKKKVKTIKIDVDKCNGCRACEVICSAFHAAPKYSSNNPARARIRVIREPLTDIYVPVYAGEHTAAECAGRDKYTIDGKEYDECAFCRASCPSRDEFKEPDSGLPLKCDMCEGEEEPLCVKWCLTDALVVEEREEEVEEGEAQEELDIGLEALAQKHGLQKILDAVAKMSKKD
jgi:benzoyl-CoA reductase subunit BamC